VLLIAKHLAEQFGFVLGLRTALLVPQMPTNLCLPVQGQQKHSSRTVDKAPTLTVKNIACPPDGTMASTITED